MIPPDDTDLPAGPDDDAASVVPPVGSTGTGEAVPDSSEVPAKGPVGASKGGLGGFVPVSVDAVDEDRVPADPAAERLARRRRRRAYIGATVVGVTLAIIVALAFVRVPYYRYSPGTLYPTETAITVTGVDTFPDDLGQIDFTTVSSKRATVLEAGLARFDPAVQMVPVDEVDGNKPPEETRRANLEMMADSKLQAQVAALRELGYTIEFSGSGALVKELSKGGPAASALHVGDAIVDVDGTKITTKEEAVAALGTRLPGDVVKITTESAPGATPVVSEVTLSNRCAGAPDQPCSAEDAAKPLLGVVLGTRDTQYKLPFQISIDTREVGGPSAGLALTLGIIDVLTPGNLTGGRHIATTGTISPDGIVGPIGGIQQKTFLAERSGVALFIVPKDEEDDAKKFASTMKVVGVTTLDEALQALADNGGNTEPVLAAAAARTPGTAN